MWGKVLSTTTLLAALAGGTGMLRAQSTGRVQGIIVDESGTPLPGVQVLLLRAQHSSSGEHQAETRNDGSFTISDVPTGNWWALARRVGHAPQRVTFSLGKGETERLALTLRSAAFALPEIAVVEEGVNNRLLVFSGKVRNRFSRWFYTREVIEKMNPKDMRELTRKALPFLGPNSFKFAGIGFANDMPGSPYTVYQDYVGRTLIPGENPFAILPTFTGKPSGSDAFAGSRGRLTQGFQYSLPRGFSRYGRSGAPPTLGFERLAASRRCVPQFYLNGQLVAIPINSIDPHALEAVEVFRPGTVPLLIDPSEGRGGCGVILAWLRSDWFGDVGTGEGP